MRTNHIYAFVFAVITLASCNSFLDVEPRDKFIDNPDFWGSENMVASYCNYFYSSYSGYGQAGDYGDFYFTSLSDDQCDPNFENWTFTSVPGSSSQWSSHWTEIRRANYAINGMAASDMAVDKQAPYLAIARLNRAYHYFELVKRYGDVQWQEVVVMSADPKDTYVQGVREDRDVIIDKVIDDLDYAIAHLNGTDKTSFTKDMARAMKADVCLYEGSYCKYRTLEDNGKAADLTRANKYFQLCADVCEELMPNYTLTPEYGTIYNSIDLADNPEVIFMRKYVKDLVGHSTVDYTRSSTTQRGITKDAIDAFLFLDGTEASAHPGEDKPELNFNNYTLNTMLAKRDKRLAVLIDTVACFRGHTWSADTIAQLAEMTSSTGYTIHKYDNPALGDKTYRNEIGKAYTDAPIYWLAIVYLNYAEAKMELGSGTDSDYDNSINLLLARAGFTGYKITTASDIEQIRRCRRCELMTDKGYRYWDLVRWPQLDKLDTNLHPDIVAGAYLQDVPDLDATVTLQDGYLRGIAPSANRTFDKKYYFYPIPSEQVTLSGGECRQNPGW